MQIVERKSDVLTGSNNMEILHELENFPVFMGCVSHSSDEDLTADQIWQINKETGLVQLKKLIPLDVLYQTQHDPGTVGQIWVNHHEEFASFINSFEPVSVLEVGGAHGILSVKYAKYKAIPWLIVEPNPIPVKDCKARFIPVFFDANFKSSFKFDTLVHSHVFEHLYDPDDFINNKKKIMKKGDKLIFSIPNLKEMIKRKYTNALNFEHTIFLTDPYIEFLLAKHGFKLIKKKYFMEDHSIFFAAVLDDKVKPFEISAELYNKNKELFLNYVRFHEDLICRLNNKLSNLEGPIYLFGAHVFSQYLIQMGLKKERITCLLDNDPNKVGLRLYGTNLKVNSPDILENDLAPNVILKAGVYNNEIKEQILKGINQQTQFLE